MVVLPFISYLFGFALFGREPNKRKESWTAIRLPARIGTVSLPPTPIANHCDDDAVKSLLQVSYLIPIVLGLKVTPIATTDRAWTNLVPK